MNRVLYLYEYEGIIPILITNNSGINGAESKWDFDLTLLMNQSNEYIHNKSLYDFWWNRKTLSTSKIHGCPLGSLKGMLLMERVGIVRPIVAFHKQKAEKKMYHQDR